MMLQLDPPLPVITNKGKGFAFAIIDYGMEFDLLFVIGLDDSGEIWTLSNKDVRMQQNISMGRYNKNNIFKNKGEIS
jgi:hypothetical protein